MDDPIPRAVELLSKRGQNDAARAMSRCTVAIRHVDAAEDRKPGAPPQADLLIHAPGEVLSEIRHTELPQGDRANQIEHALKDVLHPRFGVRYLQWSETEAAEAPRPGTFGAGPGRPGG